MNHLSSDPPSDPSSEALAKEEALAKAGEPLAAPKPWRRRVNPLPHPQHEFKTTRRVEFSETDMAGIVHYSNFFRYMESAEHAFFRSLGYSVVLSDFDPPLGLPRVHASCDYHQPLRFEDEVEIHLLVAEKRSKAITYQFRFRKLNAQPPVEVARGRLTVVCVGYDPDGRMKATAFPREIADRIAVAPAAQLEA